MTVIWRLYMDTLAIVSGILALVSTHRDLADHQDDSDLLIVGRFITYVLIAIGLRKRNVWVVRILYVLGILGLCPLLLLAAYNLQWALGTIFFVPLLFGFLAMAVLVFVPRAHLRPATPPRKDGQPGLRPIEPVHEDGNPYRSADAN